MGILTDDELRTKLAELEIDGDSYRALLILPLIEVAWADGQIQEQERSTIVRITANYKAFQAEENALIRGWLQTRPDHVYFTKARHLLLQLALREHGLGAEVNIRTLNELLDYCQIVAKAAGGLFGVAFQIEATERDAMREIADALLPGPSIDWDAVATHYVGPIAQ